MPLGGDWGSKSSTEGVDDGREPTVGLLRLLEVLHHQGTWVTSQQGKLLVLGHWVITSTE